MHHRWEFVMPTKSPENTATKSPQRSATKSLANPARKTPDAAAGTSPAKSRATVAGCCASVLAAPLPEADAQELAHGFAALADPVRLRLFSLVASADEVCSCDLQAVLGKSQPTISHHTRALADAGLIVGDKRGRWVFWRAVPTRLAALHDALS
jgi:ArsR family transcriptional regulator